MGESGQYIGELAIEVQKKLPDYLRATGREISNSNMFRCVLPEKHANDDRNMSANLTEKSDGTYVWNCYSCRSAGTIYHMANYVEGLPITGRGFIYTTLELAERFGIPVDYEKAGMTEEGKADEYTLSEMYREISHYIRTSGEGVKHLTEGRFGRSYDVEQAKEMTKLCAIGCVDSSELTDHMRSKFGDQIGKLSFYRKSDNLIDPLVFAGDVLTLAINTVYGRPIAFVGRATDETIAAAAKEGKKHPKYKFTGGFSTHKGGVLFLLDKTRVDIKNMRKAQVVEGFFDALSMRVAGIMNVVASMGTTIGYGTADALSQLGIGEIVLILDGDKAGFNGVKRSLSVLRNYDMVVSIARLPKGKDPDNIVREGKIDTFENTEDAVSFVLETDPLFNSQSQNPDVLYSEMVEFVAGVTDSTAKHRKYAAIVSEKSSYATHDVFEDVQKWAIKRQTKSTKATSIWNQVREAEDLPILDRALTLKRSAEDYLELVADASSGVMRETWEYHQSLVSREATLPRVLLTGHRRLDDATQMIGGTLTIIGGWPSTGKSSITRATTLQMLRTDPDLYVLYLSLDDPVAVTMVTIDAIITGMSMDSVKESVNSGAFEERAEVRSSYDELRDIYLNRMCIKGLDECPNLNAIRKHVEVIRTLQPNKKLKVVIDAMNNLTDVGGQDQRIAIENIVRESKRTAVEFGAHFDIITHLTKSDKPGIRPNLSHLKGTGFLEFEAKNVLLVHMDMRYNPGTQIYWTEPRSGVSLPIIEVKVAKDKGKKPGSLIPFKFDPEIGTCVEPSSDSEYAAIMAAIKGSMSSGQGGVSGQPTDDSSYM
jgi:DNA primase catalytic core